MTRTGTKKRSALLDRMFMFMAFCDHPEWQTYTTQDGDTYVVCKRCSEVRRMNNNVVPG